MNALINFRANALGNLFVTRDQRQKAMAAITSAYRAKATAALKAANIATQAPAATKQAPAPSASPISQGTGQQLGRDAFLQLLVMQMQNQDPLEPIQNTDMIAQLAQFSALEQMEGLNSSFGMLSGNVDQLNFISAQGLLGKYVEGLNNSGQTVAGTVNSVYLDGSIVVLNVDGEIVSMSGVMSIADQAPEAATANK